MRGNDFDQVILDNLTPTERLNAVLRSRGVKSIKDWALDARVHVVDVYKHLNDRRQEHIRTALEEGLGVTDAVLGIPAEAGV